MKLHTLNHILSLMLSATLLAGCMSSADVSDQPPLGYPVPEAGANQTVTEGDTVTLSGSATDSDGSIASYLWQQLSGTQVTLVNPGTAVATFTAPSVSGNLVFRLIARDNQGNAWSDNITVVVNIIPNVAPVANAGEDLAVDEGVNVILGGAGTDSDGQIVSYAWQQTAGTAVTLSDETIASPSFTAPEVNETLSFTLTVTDDDGEFHSDSVDVVVSLLPNVAPVANAGNHQIVLENSLVTLNGAGTDSDGTISTYLWQQTAGGTVSLSDTTLPTTTFTSPATKETLTFVLTVTDNEGATHQDSVDVIVGFDYTPATSVSTAPYQRTDQDAFYTDDDCTAYEPLTYPTWYSNLATGSIHKLESGSIAIVWGEDYSRLDASSAATLTQLQTDTAMQANVIAGLAELRRFVVEKHKVSISPAKSPVDGKCYQTLIHAAGTGVYSGDTNANVGGGAWCITGHNLAIPAYFVGAGFLVQMAGESGFVPSTVAHEYTHLLQCRAVRSDGDWSWYVESLANFIGNDIANGTRALDQFHQNTYWAIDTFFTRYGVWPFWMFLAQEFGYEFTGDVMQRVSNNGEGALEFLRRIAPFNCSDNACREEAFATLFGEFARSTVNYVTYTQDEGVDYQHDANFAWGWNLHRFNAYLIKVGENRYRIADWLAPQRFGYNLIELVPDENSELLMITLDGWDVPAREMQWRASLVATLNEDSVPHEEAYGEMFVSGTQVVNLSQWETELGKPIKRLHLVVAATPLNWKLDGDLSAFDDPQRYRELDRYVYELQIEGGWPLRHEPESLRQSVVETGAVHSNGGGFVASTATVAETAYVGPEARVLGNAQVLDNARIEGRAVILDNAVISGNAIVSSDTEISYRVAVSGYSTIRDNAHLADDVVVSDEGKVQGDAAIWGSYTVSQQGMTLGTPLVETTNNVTITGTAISDGARWITGDTANLGTPYNQWQVDDQGLLLSYTFEQAHPYRIRDTHVSSDAYYLTLDNAPASTGVPIQTDVDLASNVLVLDGAGYVDLPRWVLDQRSYQMQMQFKWTQSISKAFLFDAVTASGEQLAIQVVPGSGNSFYVKLIYSGKEASLPDLNLPHASFVADEWMSLSLSYDDVTKVLSLDVKPSAGGEGMSGVITLPYATREFAYDTLKARLGSGVSGTNAFLGSIDNFFITR